MLVIGLIAITHGVGLMRCIRNGRLPKEHIVFSKDFKSAEENEDTRT
jgi:hypothetical protein